VTDSDEALSVCSVITPPWTVEGVVVPVIASILDSSVCTLSVTLSSLPVAPEATNLSVVPLTEMVSLGAKLAVSESVPAAPDKAVAPVMGAAVGVTWLVTAVPVAVPSVLKKLSPASTAEAATSEVLASVEIADVSALLKLVAVWAVVAPMAKVPDGGGFALLAVKVMESVVPSGSLKVTLKVSPELGCPPAKSTENCAGEPEGPVTVAFVSVDETEFSFNPKGEVAESSATVVNVEDAGGVGGGDAGAGAVTTSRPMPLAP